MEVMKFLVKWMDIHPCSADEAPREGFRRPSSTRVSRAAGRSESLQHRSLKVADRRRVLSHVLRHAWR
eukprot:5444586-Heterocapsa_arctica.AAC.1